MGPLKQRKTLHVIKAFTLVEVLVFTAIASLIFLAAVSLTIVSVNKLKSEQYKLWANYFMDSLFEWMAGEKETDWKNFVSKAGKTYCFNNVDPSWPDSLGGCGNNFSLGATEIFGGKNLFQREATLTKFSGEDKVKVEITVTWKEKGGDRSITGVKTFSFIEQ